MILEEYLVFWVFEYCRVVWVYGEECICEVVSLICIVNCLMFFVKDMLNLDFGSILIGIV